MLVISPAPQNHTFHAISDTNELHKRCVLSPSVFATLLSLASLAHLFKTYSQAYSKAMLFNASCQTRRRNERAMHIAYTYTRTRIYTNTYTRQWPLGPGRIRFERTCERKHMHVGVFMDVQAFPNDLQPSCVTNTIKEGTLVQLHTEEGNQTVIINSRPEFTDVDVDDDENHANTHPDTHTRTYTYTRPRTHIYTSITGPQKDSV